MNLKNLNSAFEQMSTVPLLLLGLLIMFVLALADFLTGYEISFALFYLVPVTFVAWYKGRNLGIVLSVCSAVMWEVANISAGEKFSNSYIPIWNAFTRLGFFSIVTILLTNLKSMLEKERAISRTDHLTGLHNARAFYDVIRTEILRVNRVGNVFSLVYIDLDNFKYINDNYGHNTGDELLKTIAQTMRKSLRITDVVARLGGDEFSILMPDTSFDAVKNFMPKFQTTLLDVMNKNNWPVSISVGVITFAGGETNADILIRHADRLMYKVKHSGKNAIAFDVFND